MQSRLDSASAGLAAAASSSATSRPRPRNDGTKSRFALISSPPNTSTDNAGPCSTSDAEAITPTVEHPTTSRVLVSSPMVRRINGNAPPCAVVAKKIAPVACARPACVIAAAHASIAAVRGLCETEIPVPARSISFFLAENFQQLHRPLDRLRHRLDLEVFVDAVNARRFARIDFDRCKAVGYEVLRTKESAVGEADR